MTDLLPVVVVFGIEPVTSDGGISDCGMVMLAVASGAVPFNDCLPIGVGEVMDGPGAGWFGAGLLVLSAGAVAGAWSADFLSMPGRRARSPTSSRFIASLKVPSTITTTLAPTSSERILVVKGEDGLAPSLAPSLITLLGFAASLAACFAASLAFALS